jgi:hypothetical protein
MVVRTQQVLGSYLGSDAFFSNRVICESTHSLQDSQVPGEYIYFYAIASFHNFAVHYLLIT